nr:MAG TPA: hypothetical protein [Caudoviricetes sp.]
MVRAVSRQAGDWSAPIWQPLFSSQIKHWASWQISTLLRFFERPGGFVEIIMPQFVQKEKPAGKRSSAGSLYTFLRSVCTLLRTVQIVYHISNVLSMLLSR